MSALTDQAQHVTDTIDQALDDWGTSDDAMRWVPPEPNFDCPPIPNGTRVARVAAATGMDGFAAAASLRREHRAVLLGLGASSLGPHPFVLSPDEVARAITDQAHRQMEAFTLAFSRDVVPALRSTAAAFAQLATSAGIGDDALPSNPRERALEMRRHRNTGPANAHRLDGSPRRRRGSAP